MGDYHQQGLTVEVVYGDGDSDDHVQDHLVFPYCVVLMSDEASGGRWQEGCWGDSAAVAV